MPPPKRFPRWRVFQRVRARTEADVAGLWGAVIVAVAFGLVGAFVVVPKDADWRQELTPTMRPEAILQTV